MMRDLDRPNEDHEWDAEFWEEGLLDYLAYVEAHGEPEPVAS